MQLTDAVVLVTGASGGIGAATAELLAARGARVVCAGRDETALTAVAARFGGSVLTADLRAPGAAAALVEEVLTRYGRLDAVVANAGTGHAGAVAAMTVEQVTSLVDLNVRSTLLLGRAAAAAFTTQPPADRAICFVTSIAGAVGVPGESVYSATKAAVEAFALLLGEELRDRRVHVGTVLPGVVDTAFFDRRGAPYDRRVPRPVPPSRVARAVLDVLTGRRRRVVVPRWLALPAWLAGAVPGPYRALARRFG
ncbi:SDR family NAD(P)-dependent oxidoreductase [Modestobacter sp. VKM Ac-2984]|uniref:SDR family NAD(P)-dependent oxidoreductase n=1 Tax=Modestobacter sp. VKM Ac-2984 TaxID=3004138 RepID=UPI0022AB3CF3|nr:SDR family NAD(P)-dependent oxidoreductase [Modestobacter sp. VKM Ac-2984]MCZ2815990.1 SDR family NAD(P)-dependent oxidoreductase [Modestobacter sp. VKM Ac-2984]